jgi:hypothetical protein
LRRKSIKIDEREKKSQMRGAPSFGCYTHLFNFIAQYCLRQIAATYSVGKFRNSTDLHLITRLRLGRPTSVLVIKCTTLLTCVENSYYYVHMYIILTFLFTSCIFLLKKNVKYYLYFFFFERFSRATNFHSLRLI